MCHLLLEEMSHQPVTVVRNHLRHCNYLSSCDNFVSLAREKKQ